MTQSQTDAAAHRMPLGEALVYAERCRTEGRLMEAEALCRRVLETQPNLPEAAHLLGVIAHQAGKLSEAIAHVKRATKLAPQNALFHANLGEMYRQAGRHKLAIETGRRAAAIDPTMAVAWSNLGAALFELKDYEEAVRANRAAIAADPAFAQGYCNLGNALHGLKRFNEAIDAYRRAVALNPNYVDGWANLGTALHHHGIYAEAMAFLRRAIALAPEHANAHSGLGILLLMQGDFAEGWAEYEWRLRSTERKGPRFPERPWQGESLAGKHIYVQAEQGFGDTLQFARYIPLLAQRAGKVSLRVHQQLVSLMQESLPGIDIFGDRGDPAPYACDIALMSLPHLFKTRYETIPADVPYLRAPAAAISGWAQRLAPLQGLKVGLVWAGNPEHTNDMRRSLDAALLTPLLDIPGTSFVSLQFGPRAVDLKKLKNGEKRVLDLSRELGDFAHTAGAVTGLDLVITIDSSTAHLAGALGKPVWVLISSVADWRWRLDREDNAWYPNMRLFRQAEGEDWSVVIGRVGAALRAAATGDASVLMPFKPDGERRAAEAAAILTIEAARALQAAPAAMMRTQALPAGQALLLAEQKRRQGFLGDADELVRGAVATEPDNADAIHSLGIIAHQSGKLGEAITHVRRAIAIAPDIALYHANLGEMCRLAGHIDEAIAEGRRAIALQPDYPGALSNLAIALFDEGKFEEALSHLDRAVALQHNFAQAHSNRGNALQRLKRFSEAEHAYRRALEFEPKFADGWNNLGTCLRELKRGEEAEAAYREALALKPHDPDVLDNLALALKDLDRLDEAAETFRFALSIEARSDKIHVHYGALLIDQDKIAEAGAAAGRALVLNPNNPDAVNLMGRIAFEREDLHAALGHYQHAIALKPDLADAYNNMGNVLKELGRLEAARHAYIESLRLDPSVTGVYVNLADSMTFAPGDPYLAAMEALAAQTDGHSQKERFQLDFALSKTYADLKDHARSFTHLLESNAAKRATISYDEKAALAFFDRIEAVFTHQLIAAKSGGGDPSSRPIFVLGMPRSGTTLVEQILASHPMVHGAGELMALNDTVLGVKDMDGHAGAYPEFVASLDASALRQIGAHYLDMLGKLAPEAARMTDKMPSNYYFVGLIHLVLPNAKIIHTVRDPIDTCISCFSKLFTAEQNHTYDLGELGRYYRRYEQLMTHWRGVLPPRSFLDVRYEEVVANFEAEARRIIAYCGLEWDDQCLSFHATERPVRTASATQVRQPIYKSAVGRWRAYEEFLEPLLSALAGRN
ncbi:tetratricopeptide repeat protein [Methylovirgula sp. HY1]|uniref:tetratricopeptide repeat protein n=1 Tax=Methylovirgula sp. HY1 TaxID=2822761 RepID=UPI001C5B0B0E|nr:tetratricopeptide repeat protein [Methylovirgula sp. HY1]QXX76727.1 Beta-barrel assembly-enhancing protease [Methylovirgula sp. HY1]